MIPEGRHRPVREPSPKRGGAFGEMLRDYMSNPNNPGGGGPPNPTPNPLTQGVEQIVDGKVQAHQQSAPHLGEDDVKRIVQQHAPRGTRGITEKRAREIAEDAVVDNPPDSRTMADAIDQDAQPFIDTLRRHGVGGGIDEPTARRLADEQIAAARAAGQGVMPVDEARATELAKEAVEERITDGTLAKGADVTALQGRVQTVEGRLPAGADPLITENEVDSRLQAVRGALDTRVTQLETDSATRAELNRRLPPPTAGQRMLAVLGNDQARRYVNDYDTNATPAPAPATPLPVNTVDRRNLLIGAGVLLAGAGICAWLGLPALAAYLRGGYTAPTYLPGGGGTTSLPSGEYTPSGLDYSQMSPQQAEQIIKYIDANYQGQSGPTINTAIANGAVGIVTGWQVSYDGNTYTNGDTAAFTNQANVTFSDGLWRVVPSAVAKDAFVAIVVYTKALGQAMSHAQPLPEWNLPAYG